VQFAGLHPGPRRRVSLPTVVFERKRHFIDAPPLGAAEASAAPAAAANGHAPAPQGADAGALASLIEAQLVLMQRQLALLRESPPEEP
jgi:hypothetical protein